MTLLLLLVFVMFSFGNVCEYHVKCYPKGYAHSVQNQIWSSMHFNAWSIVYTTNNSCVLHTKLSVG